MRQGLGRRAMLACVAALALTGSPMAAAGPVGNVAAVADERCNFDSPLPLAQTADDLMLDRYHLGPHPAVTLPHALAWTEDPLGDRQWRQKLQQLRFVMALMYRWQGTGDAAYRDRAIELVRSWVAANPRSHPASPSAWKDQVTAWRAMTLVCMAGMLPPTPSGSTARCSPTPPSMS
jgi:hypothetical protein